MKTQDSNSQAGTNANNNTNIINVNLEKPKRRTYSRKPKTTWIKKIILGGLISFLVAYAIYFIQGSKNENGTNMQVAPTSNIVQPNN